MKLWNLSRLKGEELLLASIIEAAPQHEIDSELDRRAMHGSPRAKTRQPSRSRRKSRQSAA